MASTKVKTALRSAFSNKKLADDWVSALAASETQFKALAATLDGQADGTINVAALSSITPVFSADAVLEPSASTLNFLDKSDSNQAPLVAALNLSYRKMMRGALSSKTMGDTMVEAMASIETGLNSTLSLLSAGAPALVYGKAEVMTLTGVALKTGADVTLGALGDYFVLYEGGHSVNDGPAHYFWFTTGADAIPSAIPANARTHSVTITAIMDNSQLAQAMKAAINAVSGAPFAAAGGANVLTITNADFGNVTNAAPVSANGVMTLVQATAGQATTYVSSAGLPAFDVDAVRTTGQDHVSFRKALRSRLSNKKLADLICLHLQALHDGMNALLVLVETNTTLGNAGALGTAVSVIDPEAYL